MDLLLPKIELKRQNVFPSIKIIDTYKRHNVSVMKFLISQEETRYGGSRASRSNNYLEKQNLQSIP